VERALVDDRTSEADRFICLAAGKAAHGMAAAASRLLGDRIREGLIVAPAAGSAPPFPVIVGTHPTPTADSETAGRQALRMARTCGPDDTLLVLLSGGASSLMAVPADGVTLADKARTAELLMRGGASIDELNAVRKHLSAIKGGWLALECRARLSTLAISDVVGDHLSVIGSGPTVGDPSTFADALKALTERVGLGKCPASVVARLKAGQAGRLPETMKPDDPRLARVQARVIGGRHDAMQGAAAEAARRGYDVWISQPAVQGEARAAARARMAEAAATDYAGPACLISSGETTVNVKGTGRGGRNQEFALAAADLVARLPAPAALASVGTDGVDGPTEAAGALVDSSSRGRARAVHLEPQDFLDNNDAYAFFERLGDLIHTGPTGTNVGDLQVILLA
jgi:glycerate 2-kinase